MKAILSFLLCLSVFVSASCFAANSNDTVVGQVIQSLETKFKMLTGDKAFTSLGAKAGVIKGDILTVYGQADEKRTDAIGKCAVVTIYDSRSICEIIEMTKEIGGKDIVTLKKLASDDALLYPSIFTLLSKVVEPYPPEKKITVYIYQIFDENHNVTALSQKIQQEMVKVFYQKNRIKQVGKGVSPALFAYLPGEYNEYNKTIEDYLAKDNIDVIISGTYKIVGDKIQISYYKIDKNYEDIIVDAVVASQPYTAMAAKVLVPYTERKKERVVNCDIIFNPVLHRADSRDERNTIILAETRTNPILEYTLRRSEFNIVAPVDFALSVDGNTIRFDKFREYKLPLTTGDHQITASYRKGFYINDTFLIALAEPNVVRKSIVVSIDRPEDIVIEIDANPLPGRDNLTFKVYHRETRSSAIIKPVLRRETTKPVEVFKD